MRGRAFATCAVLLSLMCASVEACQASASAQCIVEVNANSVAAFFPLVKPPFLWRWHRETTATNALEYRWLVEFGTCSADGHFVGDEFAFGVELFKFPGASPRSGQLPRLLREAQHTVTLRKASAGRATYSVVQGADVSSSLTESGIRVLVEGRTSVARLVASRPKKALMTVNIPEPGASYTCQADVRYNQ